MRAVPIALATLGVWAVGAPAGAAVYYVSPMGDDTNSGASSAPWRTLQKAGATMVAGDTVLIADGEYPGGVVQSRSGTATAPILFRAVNAGKAVIRGDRTANRDAFLITRASHVIVDGLTIRRAKRAAIRISLSTFVTIRHCRLLDNGKWGIFTDYSDDLILERNECAGSILEHGIYVSNSGDRPIIRHNLVYGNRGSGIQINADPRLLKPELGRRGDGITEEAVIEGNILHDNGAGGGAAINLASVRSSRIVNNLIYDNRAGGIAGWDDRAGVQWGSKANLILHNTIFFRPGMGRWCISMKNGSIGNVVQNNILYGGKSGALEYDDDSSFRSDYNLLRRAGSSQVVLNEDAGVGRTLAQWQVASGNDAHSTDADPKFVNSAAAPYDFRPAAGSPAIDTGIDRPDVARDLLGNPRPENGRWDLGCYERTAGTRARAPASTRQVPLDRGRAASTGNSRLCRCTVRRPLRRRAPTRAGQGKGVVVARPEDRGCRTRSGARPAGCKWPRG